MEQGEFLPLLLAAKSGCEESRNEIMSACEPTALSVAKTSITKYCTGLNGRAFERIDPRDLAQDLLLSVPREIDRYDETKGNWQPFIFCRLRFTSIDILRKYDPLGMKVPRRHVYPNHGQLSEDYEAEGAAPSPSRMAALGWFDRPVLSARMRQSLDEVCGLK
ncbi:hypothetical protein [Rosistilla oblonga]|uniref:hypothetical protein n=1 Tax=Rosistilla oblonga TaxID=2527990 RepID=UPI003A98309B